MKKMLRIIATLLVLISFAGMLAACDNADKNQPQATESAAAGDAHTGIIPVKPLKDIYNDPIKIMVISISTMGVSNRLYQLALGNQASCYPNVTIEFKDAEYDPNKQITLLQEAVTQNYDGVLIECMDPVALNEAITAAERAGIPVISNGAAQPTCLHSMHNRMEDYANGWTSGEIMAGLANGEGTAIILDAPAVQKPSARMANGFQDYIEQNTNITLLEPPIGIENWSADNAQIAMRDVLTKYGPGQITMVYCASDDIALGAMNAIDQAGRTGDMMLWGMFGYPEGLEGVKNGRMTGTMLSDVYVQYSMLFFIMMEHIATGLTSYTGGYESTPFIKMPMFAVTKDNVDNIMITSRWYE